MKFNVVIKLKCYRIMCLSRVNTDCVITFNTCVHDNKSNTTGAKCGIGTAYPSGAYAITAGF